ncbi:MAG: RNA polymerase sigma-70 factor [Nannocystaceae bacterium]|nr:RNA polymerase sigma-70 factor [Nannocystaceae bacterium]
MSDPVHSERPRLVALAYRMLGSVAEAEDVVQDVLLRFGQLDATTVRNPAALLTTMVTRKAIHALERARVRRQHYDGPWLPEPMAAAGFAEVDPATISSAFLLLLEALSPRERAAFLLARVFDYSHDEIAAALGIEVASSRQLLHRAQAHVDARKPRFPARPEDHARLVANFGAAIATGDVEGLQRLLAADAAATADHGGKASAARRPVTGRDHVARLLLGLARKGAAVGGRLEPIALAGEPGLLMIVGSILIGAMTVRSDGREIVGVDIVRNPDKLARLAREHGLQVSAPFVPHPNPARSR